MEIGINDLDDDDDILEGVQQEQQEVIPQSSNDNNDFMSDFLRSKGIDDLEKIKFEDENGNIEERSWNDLSRQEQINILNTPIYSSNDSSDELTDEEIELLQQIRNSNLSPIQYIEQIKGEQIVQEPQYKVDDLSDDELFLLDLESRVGQISEEEAAQALTNAKQNEDFYKRQTEGIRKEYKEREDYMGQQEEARLQQERDEATQQYQSQVIDIINNFNSIGNLDLQFEDSDKEELADFMLSQDVDGNNYFYNALQDPETLVKAAWFILNGEEAFDSITDYFTNQIKLVSDNQYRKGFEDAKKGNTPSRPTIVIDNSKQQQNLHRSYKSIEDLYDED